MIELAIGLLLLAAQEPPAGAIEPRHWDNARPAWSRMPLPDFPDRERGTVQAEITCTLAERGRVRDCRVDRVAPARTRFGREVLRSLPQARLFEGRASPGDTMTFIVWACGPSVQAERCEKIDWPTAD